MIEIMKKNGKNQTVSVLEMLNEDGEKTDSCPHPGKWTVWSAPARL